MKLSSSVFCAITLICGLATQTAKATSWPAGSGIDITADLLVESAHFEPSDMIWHSGINQLVIVGDGGEVCTMDSDGTNVDCVDLGSYQWEGIAVADVTTNYVYLDEEYNSSGYATIYEYDLSTQSLTGSYWELGHVTIDSDNNLGSEAITFIPNDVLPATYSPSSSGGLFYVASQYTGSVYVYDLNLSVSGDDTYIGEFTPEPGYTDLAAMFYSADTNTIYISYDANDWLVETDLEGTPINDYAEDAPAVGQEAVAIIASCPDSTGTFYIGFDQAYAGGPLLYQYTGYPIDCSRVDKDADGVAADVDCDDNDATSTVTTTYYLDADGDGLGDAANAVTDCSIPAGYVSNSSDANDSDFDNDGDPTASDCDDADSTSYAGASELPDGLDNDCDNISDDGLVSIAFDSLPRRVTNGTTIDYILTNNSGLTDFIVDVVFNDQVITRSVLPMGSIPSISPFNLSSLLSELVCTDTTCTTVGSDTVTGLDYLDSYSGTITLDTVTDPVDLGLHKIRLEVYNSDHTERIKSKVNLVAIKVE